eukprot:Rhum_TRINITY_DN19186_c0_g1::Rhum_TRINITY_DN19186_c0_g1_i1::g.169473::m.169473
MRSSPVLLRDASQAFNAAPTTGLSANEEVSSYYKIDMYKKKDYTPWMVGKTDMARGSWWSKGHHLGSSYRMPKAIQGKGFEYQKFFGAPRYIKPFYNGGPMEAVHDEVRNKAFHNAWEFPADLRKSLHLPEHIRTQPRAHRWNQHFSRKALKVIAKNAYQLTDRSYLWNPYNPHQPMRGPAAVTTNEMEVYRKQAFLQGIEYPEFPDIKPQEQVDPWEEDAENAIPKVHNDTLLNKEVWTEVNKNMRGMEQKIKAFKDAERKKRYTWEMANLMASLKKAAQEETFMAKVATKQQNKEKFEEQQNRKPWERAKAEEDVSEEQEDVGVDVATQEEIKEEAHHKRQAASYRPPGTKL